jgi:hypothetical protein
MRGRDSAVMRSALMYFGCQLFACIALVGVTKSIISFHEIDFSHICLNGCCNVPQCVWQRADSD